MNDKEKIFFDQIEEVLDQYNDYQKDKKRHDNKYNQLEMSNNLITRITAIVSRVTGINSEYYKRILGILTQYKAYIDDKKLVPLKGVLGGLYQDLKAGYLKTLSELIHAEIFSNYIEMAEYLLDEGYKDPAAVITGSTLEEHLRTLCIKNGIDIEIMSSGKLRPKKADGMNSDLAKRGTYSKLEQKSVTAWLDLRNKAAHGHYSEYDDNQVKLMINGVRDFITRNPA